MPGWSQNPFWEDEVEDSSTTAFDEAYTLVSPLSAVQQSVSVPAPVSEPSTSKKITEKKKSASADSTKKRAAKKPKTSSRVSLVSSESEEEAIPATQPPVKRKRPTPKNQHEEETFTDKGQKPVRAAILRSFLTQRGATGFTTQRDPIKTGEYFIELRVYNSREAERLPADERWKNAITTLKLGTDTNTPVWRAVSKLVQAGKEDFAHIQPIMYPSAQ